MAKHSKKTPAAKSTTPAAPKAPRGRKAKQQPAAPAVAPPAAPSIRIVDACAAAGCVQPPQPGSSYCSEHTAAEAARTAAAAAKVAVDGAKNAIATMVATAAAAKTLATTPAAAVPAEAVRPTTKAQAAKLVKGDASQVIKDLVAKGWDMKTLATALSTSPGRVWFWAKGKTCRRIDEVLALVHLDPPTTVKAMKVVKGSLKAKGAPRAQAARAMPLAALPDPRQLMLDLQQTLTRALDVTGGK